MSQVLGTTGCWIELQCIELNVLADLGTGDGDGDGTLEVPMPDIDNLGKERSRQLSGLQRRRISKRVTQTERVRAATLGQSYH